jgi:hypothetical protein
LDGPISAVSNFFFNGINFIAELPFFALI